MKDYLALNQKSLPRSHMANLGKPIQKLTKHGDSINSIASKELLMRIETQWP